MVFRKNFNFYSFKVLYVDVKTLFIATCKSLMRKRYLLKKVRFKLLFLKFYSFVCYSFHILRGAE